MAWRCIGGRRSYARRSIDRAFSPEGYRAQFGAVTTTDRALRGGQRGPAPYRHGALAAACFIEDLVTLFDYLPDAHRHPRLHGRRGGCRAASNSLANNTRARVQARHDDETSLHAVYKPLPPEKLYLSAKEWPALPVAAQGCPLRTPLRRPTAERTSADAGGWPGRSFAPGANSQPDVDLFGAVHAYCADAHRAGRRVVIGCISQGSRDRLAGLLDQHEFRRSCPRGRLAGRERFAGARPSPLPCSAWRTVLPPAISPLSRSRIFLATAWSAAASGRATPKPFCPRYRTSTVGDFVVHAEHGIGRYEGPADA